MRKTALALALAVVVGGAGLVAQPGVAEARSGISFGFSIGGHPHPGFFFGPRIFIGPRFSRRSQPIFLVGPCHWLKVKAFRTGSPYWFGRWQQCRSDRAIY